MDEEGDSRVEFMSSHFLFPSPFFDDLGMPTPHFSFSLCLQLMEGILRGFLSKYPEATFSPFLTALNTRATSSFFSPFSF